MNRVVSLLLLTACAGAWWCFGAAVGSGLPVVAWCYALAISLLFSVAVLADRAMDRIQFRRRGCARCSSFRRTLEEIRQLPEIPSG